MKEKKVLNIDYYGDSDIGLVRTENQDSFGKFPKDDLDIFNSKGLLFLVADGMGGHTGGKEASKLAVDIVSDEYFSSTSDVVTNALLYAFKNANLKIHQSSMDSPQFNKMGTTCSALVIENGRAHIAHVGDSRIYKIADDNIIQFTNDHTEVNEMFRKGILTQEEVKNHPSKSVLVRAMGIEADIEVDLIENVLVNSGDCFVLCSDGLAKVEPEEIKQVVMNNSAEDAARKLIELANEKGGKDNVTVEVIKILDSDLNDEPQKTIIKSERKKSRRFPLILLAVILVVVILGFLFKDNLKQLFYNEPAQVIDTLTVNINKDSIESSDQLIIDANNLLSQGKLDSSAALYQMVLSYNPLHIGALGGLEVIAQKYIEKGYQANENKNYNEALFFFKKALIIDPDNKELRNMISKTEKNIITSSNSELKKNPESVKKDKINNEVVSKDNKDEIIRNDHPFLASIDLNEWSVSGLTTQDYKLYDGGFKFYNSSKLKHIYYKKPLEDIDLEVNIEFEKNQGDSKCGIIFGQNQSENPEVENYYLFLLDCYNNFSLVRNKDGKEDFLIPVKHSSELAKDKLKIKIKCLGPWIMVYCDNKLLDSYLEKDFIKGRIGFYASPEMQAEFTAVKISSAFEKK